MTDSFISKLITELTAKTTASDTDLVPIADSNGNFFKMTFAKLKELITSELNTKLNNKDGYIYIGTMNLGECYIYSGNDGTFNVRIKINGAYHYFTINSEGVFFDGGKL